MKFYKAAIGILAGAAVFALYGCGSGAQEVKQTNESLTLCVSDYINDTYQDGFEEFKKAYPDVELNVEVYTTDLLASVQRINTQIMAGEGPDLLLMSNYGTADVYKMMKAQAFAPLDEFMEKDSGWDQGNYAKAVLDAGIYEEKQMVMPLSYYVQIALTSKENLEAAGISLDSCDNMAAFLQETAKFYELDSAQRVTGDVAQLVSFPSFLSGRFLDYSSGTIGVDEQTMEQACAAYKNFYFDDMESSSSLPDTGFYGIGEAIADGKTCMVVLGGNSFMEASQALAANATPVLWPFQNGDGQISASIMDYAGIRANSENRQNAWNMIKILMGEAAQSQVADMGLYCPVLKSALADGIDHTKEKAYETGKKLVEMKELPQEALAQYKDAVMDPQKALFITDICVSKFRGYMQPFYEDEGSYEDCMKEFRKFIKIYLTE